MARLISYTLVGICHPSSHISLPTEIYLDSNKIQIQFSSLESASNTKKPARDSIYVHYALASNSVLFFFSPPEAEYNWLHNCSIIGLNQRISSSKRNPNQARAKDSGKEKDRTTRERETFLGKGGGGIWHFLFPQRLEEYGKRYLHNQRKYVQLRQQSQGVEDAERQL